MIIAKYKFNPSIYSNLLPKFNSAFTSYTKSDVNNGDGTITRTIESTSLPTRIKFGYRDDTTNTKVAASSLLEVIELNTDNVNTTRDMFRYCTNLVSVNTTNWNINKVTDTRSMFTSCPSLTSLDLNNWNTSKVTNMNYMFGGCTSLTSLDLSNWDTSNVTDMYYMFYECSSLTQLDLSNWNTSKVTNMSYMFDSCTSLASLNVSNWDTSNVTDISSMFANCSSLTSLDINNFDTSNVTDMYDVFHNCTSLTSLNISNWNTSSATSMSNMFDSCSTLTSLNINNWNTSSATSMSNMFENCTSLTSLNISNWNTSSVTNMSYMFNSCTSLTSLDINNWNISQATDIHNMFSRCSALTSLDLSNWDTSNVTDMSYLFEDCPSLTQINISNWDTSKVTNMTWMFYKCTNLTSLDISNFNTINVTNANNMFRYCTSLRKVALRYANKPTLSKIHENLPDRTDTTKGYILSPTSLTLSKNWEILKTNYNEFYLPQPLRKVGDVKDRFYWDEDKGHYCIEQNITSTLEVLETPIIIDLPYLNQKLTFDSYAPSTSIDIPNVSLKPSKVYLDAPIARYRCKILKPSTQYNVQFDCKGDSGIKVNLGGTEVTFTPTSEWTRKNLTITTPSELVNDKLSISNVGITSNNKVDNVMLFSEVIAQEPDYIDGIQSIGEFTESDTVKYKIEIETYDSRWDSI